MIKPQPSKKPLHTLTVRRKERDPDRVRLYPHPAGFPGGGYHVIASLEAGSKVRVGDEIAYEPDGVNFGWLIAP